jgi:branched-subunit amino acid ABC-type transport system permease component
LWIFAVLLLARTRFYTQIKGTADRYSVAEKFGVNVQRAWFFARVLLAI